MVKKKQCPSPLSPSPRYPFWPKLALWTAKNFPENFSRKNILLVDLGKVQSAEQLQGDITKVMVSVYGSVSELGGRDAERRALIRACSIRRLLNDAALHYRRKSTARALS